MVNVKEEQIRRGMLRSQHHLLFHVTTRKQCDGHLLHHSPYGGILKGAKSLQGGG